MSQQTVPRHAAEVGSEAEEVLQLRYRDTDSQLVDINARDLADVLDGLITLTNDLAKAGLFGDNPAPEVRVRPPQEGSFVLIAAFHWALENPEGAGALLAGTGGLAAGVANMIKLATKMLRVDVADFDHLDNGNVKINWQDGTASEVPPEAWAELNKRKRKRKKALAQIMAPIGDEADILEVRAGAADDDVSKAAPAAVVTKEDYLRASHVDTDEAEGHEFFEDEAQVHTLDFVGDQWKVKTSNHGTRKATVEDQEFLLKVDRGLALRKSDIFHLKIREDWSRSNGRTTKAWTVLKVTGHRRGSADKDGS